MAPASREPSQVWWHRLKIFFLAAVAVQGIHLGVFGLDPQGFTLRHPWSSGLDRLLFWVAGALFVAVVACWLEILLNSRHAPIPERRAFLAVSVFCLVTAIGQRWKGAYSVYVACTAAEILLLSIWFWYFVKALQVRTQKAINAKLNRSAPAASEVGAGEA